MIILRNNSEWNTCSCSFGCDKLYELLSVASEYKNKDIKQSTVLRVRELHAKKDLKHN